MMSIKMNCIAKVSEAFVWYKSTTFYWYIAKKTSLLFSLIMLVSGGSMEFINYQPTKIVFGKNKVDSLAQYALEYGQKAFVIGPVLCEAIQPLLARIENILSKKMTFQTFYQVEPNPSIRTVDAVVKMMRDFELDVVIGVGGGSVLDVAKISSILYGNKQYTWDFLFDTFNDFRKHYEKMTNRLPLLAIPTTSGTGSQCTQACVLTDTDKLKKTIFHQDLYATLAILDPTLTLSLPPAITKATAFDAFSHCVESFLRSENSICNLLAKEGIKKVTKNLPLVLKENRIEYREELMLADTFGGISLSNCGAMLPHPLSEIIGSYTNICHGEALAIVYPPFLHHTLQKYQKKYAALARYLFPTRKFSDEIDAAKCFIEMVDTFMQECKLNKHISDYNMDQDTIDHIHMFITNLHLPMESEETIENILKEIWSEKER